MRCAPPLSGSVMSTVRSVGSRLVNGLGHDVRKQVATDPMSAAREQFGLKIIEIGNPGIRGEGGTCDGFSFLDAGVIHYRPTWTDRQYFTIAHELAHFLVEQSDLAMDWLASQASTRRLLEDLCDAIAGRLLIPDEVVRTIGSTPTGQDIAKLYNSLNASRSACVVRIAERLLCDGFAALVDAREQRVFFASRSPDTRPYAWQGDQVPEAHPLRRIRPGQEMKMETWWPFPNSERARYYLSAFREDDWVYAVFAEDDLWSVVDFHPPEDRERDRRPEFRVRCDCGFDKTIRAYPCPTCRQPECPQCRRCNCDRRDERPSARCSKCGLTYARHLIEDEVCVDCR